MSAPYFARLLCLSMGVFFLAHLVLTAIVSVFAAKAIERARRMCPRDGARLLFALRLSPAVFAGALVAGVCAPSYLWLEPEMPAEEIGPGCLAAAALGGVCCAQGIARALRATWRSSRYLRACERVAESDVPVLMLAGVFRHRLLVSRGIRRALTSDQLAVAMRHERAHGASQDNLKRLLLLLAPDAVPFVRWRRIEEGWRRLTEWAADDDATDGSRQGSLALAAALVRVARMGAVPAEPLATSLLGDRDDLAVRVERLLAGSSPERVQWPFLPLIFGALAILVLAAQPATFVAAHRALEFLIH